MGFRQGTPKMLGGEACAGLILVGFRQGTHKMLGGEACKRKMYDLPANGIMSRSRMALSASLQRHAKYLAGWPSRDH
jgi:hypothetical protein